METLVSDCLPPIFSYLSLADLLHLRILSRRLKQEVEDYLPNVRSLPLYLTTPRTPEKSAEYENFCVSVKNKSIHKNDFDSFESLSNIIGFSRLQFGTSGQGAFEDVTILQNQNHFRRSDFLILNHSSALLKFLPFIKKYCPNIEKLALVIDHCDHYLPYVSIVFKEFPAIKVLLLERTLQDSFRHFKSKVEPAYRFFMQPNFDNLLRISPEVYKSIQSLNHLEELYFFPKRQGQLWMTWLAGNPENKFVKTLFERLKVFHLNIDFSMRPPGRRGYEIVEELACPTDIWLTTGKRIMFPRLKKLILLGCSWNVTTNRNNKPTLKVLDISINCHTICPKSTKKLSYFTNLESFYCGSIEIKEEDERMENADEEGANYDLKIVPDNLKNWTIKHLQVMKGLETAEKRTRDARRWSKYFVALETCTFFEPEYSVVRISDLQK